MRRATLRDGDVVEVALEGVGVLTTRIRIEEPSEQGHLLPTVAGGVA
ncbi:hypothetical protein [Pseudonocardia sp. WMMC193]|nr:hypothetical protein [Pseudonocardia sp. WMMC193]MCF7549568.1 hypothetical protein [Pseudonocardia sp. WMMC193]